jgi:hypothetical protein
MAGEGYSSPFCDDEDLIPDEAILLRRVPPDFIDWEELDQHGLPRITSAAFQDYSAQKAQSEFGLPGACMSVIVLAVVINKGRDAAELLIPFGAMNGLSQMSASTVRSCGQGVQMDPRPGEPWHAVVFAKTKAKKDNTMKSCLAAAASWHTPPTVRPPSA